MKLTKRDTKDIVTWGAAGLVAAAMYQLTSIWCRHRTNVQDLDPSTEALFRDDYMFSLFCQLQEYRSVDEKMFRKSVDECDRLVFHHMLLREGVVAPDNEDSSRAFVTFTLATKYLESFVRTANKSNCTRTKVYVHRFYTMIHECLENHLNGIFKLSNEL